MSEDRGWHSATGQRLRRAGEVHPAGGRDRAPRRSPGAARQQALPPGRRLRARCDRPRHPWPARGRRPRRDRRTLRRRVLHRGDRAYRGAGEGGGRRRGRRHRRRQDRRHRQDRGGRQRRAHRHRADHRLDRRALRAAAVRYSREGVYQESISLPRNPDVVVVDSALIAKAPVRFLVAGIGDALSTWFEARSNLESRSNNYIRPGLPAPEAGVAIARACHEVLMRDALAAKIACERGALTPAVEAIIEANTLLSGLGFENCGVSAAHGIRDGLHRARRDARLLPRREAVAFGVLCLLMLEGRPLAEIEATARFCCSVGLPTTLADLKLAQATPARHRARRRSRAQARLRHLARGRAAFGGDRARRHPGARRLHLGPGPGGQSLTRPPFQQGRQRCVQP